MERYTIGLLYWIYLLNFLPRYPSYVINKHLITDTNVKNQFVFCDQKCYKHNIKHAYH